MPVNVCTIYLITNNINGMIYVGQTWDTVEHRFRSHCSQSSSALSKDIRTYGAENFTKQAIACAPTQSDANFLEQHFIALLDSTNLVIGYNRSKGGGGKPQKLSAAQENSIIADYLGGATIISMCVSHKVSKGRIKSILRENSVSERDPKTVKRPAPSNKTPVEIEQLVIAAYIAGVKFDQIKQSFDLDASTLTNIIKRNKLVRRKNDPNYIHPRIGHEVSDITRAKIGSANRGKTRSDEEKAHLSALNIGKSPGKHSSDMKQKLREIKGMSKEKELAIVKLYADGVMIKTIVNDMRTSYESIIRIAKEYGLKLRYKKRNE